jgi:hypothetical protein
MAKIFVSHSWDDKTLVRDLESRLRVWALSMLFASVSDFSGLLPLARRVEAQLTK